MNYTTPLQAAMLLLLPVSAAFSTLRLSGLSAPAQFHRHFRSVLSSDRHQNVLADEDPVPLPSNVLAQELVESALSNDEVFLNSIENTSPDSILAGKGDESLSEVSIGQGAGDSFTCTERESAKITQEGHEINGKNEMMMAETSPLEEALGALGANSTSSTFAPRMRGSLKEAVLGGEPDTTKIVAENLAEDGQEIAHNEISENVEAVMQVSMNAIMYAEATLDVKEGLGSFGANSTSFTPPLSAPVEEPVDIVPVKEVVGEPATTKISAPAVGKILRFAVAATAVWLASPLLSLIDTSTVGKLAGTAQQAALNPAVAVTDYAALLIAFLFTASTNLIASAEESDRTLPGKPRTSAALKSAMQISTYTGLALGLALFAFARPLLRAIIGNDALDPTVFAAAMKYVRIRALGMPAAAIIGSAQASSVGAKDTLTPMRVLGAAALVNLCGDLLFVGSSNPLFGGAAGAAWATVFSQYAALGFFIRLLTKKSMPRKKPPKVLDLSKDILDFMGKPTKKGGEQSDLLTRNEVELQQETAAAGSAFTSRRNGLFGKVPTWKLSLDAKRPPKDGSPSVLGLLEGRLGAFDLLKLPPKAVAKEFAPYVAPVTVTQIGRVSGYVAMSHVVSSSLGTISMAAQQVIVSFFYCLTPIADSLSLTAQSFLPGISDRQPSKERADALRRAGRNFMKAGGVFGAVMAVMIGLLPIISGFFTSDATVVCLVNMVVPLLVAFFSVHGVLCASEGVLLGQKDLGFLGKMYGAYFFAVPFLMLRVKRAALSGIKGINLSSVWTVFLGYQIFRLLAWVARVEIIQKRTDREAEAAEFL